ncbi:hypothetical protein MPR_0825 [Myroides profundi]|nr:hypothetical protein MPR_0825 [Myroides profundi]
MDVLKQLCINLGLQNVQTYIQSGNIIYQSVEVDSSILSKKIQDKILSTLNLTVPTLTLDIDQFEEILVQHPFTKEEELAQLYITFIDGTPQQEGINSLEEKKNTLELLHTTDNAIYLVANIGYGKTKITNALIENKLKVTATTRNYKTCLKIKALATK